MIPMKSLLEELYYGNYERRFVRTPEYTAATAAMTKTWDAAGEKLSREELDALWSIAMEVSLLEGYDDFRAEFRLGMSLMREAFPQPGEK